MAKKIRKPKPKKLPKRPKQRASIQVWERWKQKVDETVKANEKALRDWEQAKKKAENDEKKKRKLMAYNPKNRKSARY